MASVYHRWVWLKNRFKSHLGLQTLSLAVLVCALDSLLHLRFFILEVQQSMLTLDSVSGEGWIHALVFLSLGVTVALLYRASTRWTSLSAGQMSQRMLQQEGSNCKTWGEVQALFFQALRIGLPLTELALLQNMESQAELGSEVLSDSILKFQLIQGGQYIATLFLFLARNEKLDGDQQSYLQNLIPELTITVENYLLRQRTEEDIASVRYGERQRISRYLHDTLSHNLAYLRLMLDYQLHSRQQAKGAGDAAEVERMLNVANESYEEVRNLLVNLREAAPADLATTLQAEAASMADRTGLDIAVEQIGQAGLLSDYASRQVLLIFREALHNIEKHARASRVRVKLHWTLASMRLLIEDDGVGFQPGFNEDHSGPGRTQHHGIRIMKECAADINAQVMFSPAAPSGTCVELCLPIEDRARDGKLTQPVITHREILEMHHR